jgi:class 3 adenylate cyclase
MAGFHITKIRTKFLLFILLPVLFTITLAGVVSFWVSKQVLVEELWNLGLANLQQSADRIDTTFGVGVQALRVLSMQKHILHTSEPDLRFFFVELQKKFPIEAIHLASLDGKLVTSIDKSRVPADYSPIVQTWFVDALDSDDVIISSPLISPFSGNPVITVAKRVTDRSGSAEGVIAYDLPLSAMRPNGTRLQGLNAGEGVVFSIFGRDGVFLSHSDESLVGRKLGESNDPLHVQMRLALSEDQPSWAGIGTARGEGYFGGYQKSRYGDLYMGLEIPLMAGMQPVFFLAGSYITLCAVCLVLLSIMLLKFARKIVKPARLLHRAVKGFSKGDYDQNLPVTTKDELGDLIQAFNEMSQGLKQRDFIRNTFGRYVTPEIVDQVLESEDGLKLGGEKREITILMSDLRGFSATTAKMPPEKVIHLLNRYLAKMIAILLDNQAIVDEMQGDGIVAFFGAPVHMDDYAGRAVACAIDMQAAMAEINEMNQREGLPRLQMGIGINTGEVVVGNIGSERRTKYGAVGAAVNFTGRVESCTLGDQILVSESTYKKLKPILEVQGTIRVKMKGFSGDVTLYNVKGIQGPYNRRLEDSAPHPPPLAKPVAVEIRMVEEKTVTPRNFKGMITRMSQNRAVIVCTDRIAEPAEIYMIIGGGVDSPGEAFAKVTSAVPNAGVGYAVSIGFTFISSEWKDLIADQDTQ